VENLSPKTEDGHPAGRSETKKVGANLKDWITLPFSILALLISGLAFYFNVVRQFDDVRILIATAPYIKFDEDDRTRFAIEPEETVLFINSGNRSAAITFVKLYVSQDRGLQTECQDPKALMLEYDTEPFSLKPGEIISKTMRLKGKMPPEHLGDDPLKVAANGFVTFPVAGDVQKDNKYWIQVCMSVPVLTPDSYTSIEAIELYQSEINQEGAYVGGAPQYGNLINTPVPLVRNLSTIFSRR
jgi:hypothetical protein